MIRYSVVIPLLVEALLLSLELVSRAALSDRSYFKSTKELA
jgi:hypothetical protein